MFKRMIPIVSMVLAAGVAGIAHADEPASRAARAEVLGRGVETLAADVVLQPASAGAPTGSYARYLLRNGVEASVARAEGTRIGETPVEVEAAASPVASANVRYRMYLGEDRDTAIARTAAAGSIERTPVAAR